MTFGMFCYAFGWQMCVLPAGGMGGGAAGLATLINAILPTSLASGFFTIVRDGYSEQNRYVQSVELNGKALDRYYITHDEVVAGGKLTFRMGAEKKAWY